jgi:hypothetical protein
LEQLEDRALFSASPLPSIPPLPGPSDPGPVLAAAPVGGAITVQGHSKASVANFFGPNANYVGGVRVAAGDLNGDGRSDVIAAVTIRGGLSVAVGDVNGDGTPDVIAIGQGGTRPRMTVFEVAPTMTLRSLTISIAPDQPIICQALFQRLAPRNPYQGEPLNQSGLGLVRTSLFGPAPVNPTVQIHIVHPIGQARIQYMTFKLENTLISSYQSGGSGGGSGVPTDSFSINSRAARSRLMEEEGIYYFYNVSSDVHRETLGFERTFFA